MSLTKTEKIDVLNIGLMMLSFAIAIIIPFELFLFSYAILGPLHYLTEISWLHDRQYFAKGKYDAIVLLVVGLLITLAFFNGVYGLEIDISHNFTTYLTFIALASALIMVLVKNVFYKVAGILLIILASQVSTNWAIFLTMFLPTLIHVYIFTGLFMLYGALKSKSRFGVLSVVFLALCAVALFFVFPDRTFLDVTEYGKNAYMGQIDNGQSIGFFGLHQGIMHIFYGTQAPQGQGMEFWLDAVFHSSTGILIARFIAFAYTYHYLNWFSKTQVIQWHKVSKARVAIVVVFYIASIGLYIYNYAIGLQWLFFLSFLHVLLEFPLNFVSIIGIGSTLRSRLLPGSKEVSKA